MYGVAGERLATLIRDVITFPGLRVIDDCPWKRVFEVWPDPLPSLADAAILAVVATTDTTPSPPSIKNSPSG